jgi:hypothetical protein
VDQAVKILQQAGFEVAVKHGLGPDVVTVESPLGQAPKGSTITIGTGLVFP